MYSERLLKKLSIFYHPLFQNLIGEWMKLLKYKTEHVNFVTFVEVNVRIQKILIKDCDVENSLTSALTDWGREISNMGTPIGAAKKENKKNGNPKKDVLINISETIQGLPFEPVLPYDHYMAFFRYHSKQNSLYQTNNLLSFSGFGKFLFDLCSSWCENLDIELFMYFVFGLLMQLTEFDKHDNLQMIKFDYLECMPNPFQKYLKTLKQQYTRYKKCDLKTYESFYEWNYLPFRLAEVKNKFRECLNVMFPSEGPKVMYFQGIIEKSINEIVKKNLVIPPQKFGTDKDDIKFQDDINVGASIDDTNNNNNNNPNLLREISNDSRSSPLKDLDQSLKIKYDPGDVHKHIRIEKKISMPIIGKQIPKDSATENNNIVTIKSVALFLDPDDEVEIPTAQDQNGLYPIWERETSECNSIEGSSKKGDDFLFELNENFTESISPKDMDKVYIKSQFLNQNSSRNRTEPSKSNQQSKRNLFQSLNENTSKRPEEGLSILSRKENKTIEIDRRPEDLPFISNIKSPIARHNKNTKKVASVVSNPSIFDSIIQDCNPDKIKQQKHPARLIYKKIESAETRTDQSLNLIASNRIKLREIGKKRAYSNKRAGEKPILSVVGIPHLNPINDEEKPVQRFVINSPNNAKTQLPSIHKNPIKEAPPIPEIDIIGFGFYPEKVTSSGLLIGTDDRLNRNPRKAGLEELDLTPKENKESSELLYRPKVSETTVHRRKLSQPDNRKNILADHRKIFNNKGSFTNFLYEI